MKTISPVRRWRKPLSWGKPQASAAASIAQYIMPPSIFMQRSLYTVTGLAGQGVGHAAGGIKFTGGTAAAELVGNGAACANAGASHGPGTPPESADAWHGPTATPR